MNVKVRRIWRRLTANKAKFSTMVALLAVALLMWGRLLLKQVPRTAVATPVVARSVSNAAPMGAGGAGVAAWAGPVPVEDDLIRDLFAVDPTVYRPPENQRGKDSAEEKLRVKPTDDLDAARRLRTLAASLVLQSTLQDGQPRAVINGKLLLIGHTIDGFTLRRVATRRVTLERDGIEFELEL